MENSTIKLILIFVLISIICHRGDCSNTMKPVIFNFGDSNSATYPIGLPNGRLYFPPGQGRASDGRLIIDFLCETVNASYIVPYDGWINASFSNGANFAVGSACADRGNPTYVTVYLKMEVDRFLEFRSRSLQLSSQGVKGLLSDHDFKNALYTIDIGQNDLHNAYWQAYEGVVKSITTLMIPSIKDAIETIYAHGGRKFWVHGTGPLGCIPEQLYNFKVHNNNSDPFHYNDVDKEGCLFHQNEGAKEFNKQLKALCEQLRSEMHDITIVYVDIYDIKYDIIANPEKYGFETPLMACCGYGGPPYNFNSELAKKYNHTGFYTCSEVEASKRINWDGTHYTQAANKIVASRILSKQYSTPKINWDQLF